MRIEVSELNRIKELRKKNNLTLKQLGQQINMLDSTLSQYENGKRKPKEEIWQKIADYFKVSVPYLKGLTLDAKQLAKRLIPEIHQSYFDTWCFLNKPRKNGTYHDYSPEFVTNVNEYITLSSDNSKLPVELYSDDEVEYKLSNRIYKYWEKNFSSIFDEISSKEVSSNTNTFFLFDEFKNLLKKRKEKLIHQNSSSLTALGFFYKAEFDNEDFSENRMHDNMRIMLMHGKLKTAQQAINKYADVINKLKKEVNDFDQDKYFMYRFDNIVMPVQNPFNANLIMNEVYKRVHSGDTDLLHFIMKNDAVSLIRVYYDYKKLKNEDTHYLYKLQEENKQRQKLLSDDSFRIYLANNYDFSTPDKIYDIEALYKKYKQDSNK